MVPAQLPEPLPSWKAVPSQISVFGLQRTQTVLQGGVVSDCLLAVNSSHAGRAKSDGCLLLPIGEVLSRALRPLMPERLAGPPVTHICSTGTKWSLHLYRHYLPLHLIPEPAVDSANGLECVKIHLQ